MDYLVYERGLPLEYWPGKGAWTYRLTISDSQAVPGTWGHIKVSGTLDGHAITGRNLAPITGGLKILSLNAGLRRQLGKQAGELINTTLYLLPPPAATSTEADVLACLAEAGVLDRFRAWPAAEQAAWLRQVLAQPEVAIQEQRILAAIDRLAGRPATK